jgi:hypothetical protein
MTALVPPFPHDADAGDPPVEVALIGPFDVPSLGWQLTRRVVDGELRDRGANVRLRVFAPTAGGPGLDPVEALGTADAGVVKAFRDRFTHVLVAGDPALASPWAGPDQQVVQLDTDVDDVARIARRQIDEAALGRHREFLVAMEWWPRVRDHDVVVVQGEAGYPSNATTVVVVEAEPGDDRDGERRISLREGASVDDVVAAIALADDVVATAPSVLALDAAFAEHDPSIMRLDAQLDDLCRAVAGVEPARLVTREVAALRDALDTRGRRLAWERAAMADRVWEIERRLEGELAARDARIAELERERDALRQRIEVRARAALGKVKRRFAR